MRNKRTSKHTKKKHKQIKLNQTKSHAVLDCVFIDFFPLNVPS